MSNASPNPPDLVAKIEGFLGRELPTDYKEWLASNKSDFPIPNQVTIPADPPYSDAVEVVYPANEVIRWLEQEEGLAVGEGRQFPEGMFPIADNGGGDYFLMSVGNSDHGTIHYFSHEESNPDDNLWGLYLLSSGFKEWLEMIEKEDPGDQFEQPPTNTPARVTPSMKQTRPWWRFW